MLPELTIHCKSPRACTFIMKLLWFLTCAGAGREAGREEAEMDKANTFPLSSYCCEWVVLHLLNCSHVSDSSYRRSETFPVLYVLIRYLC